MNDIEFLKTVDVFRDLEPEALQKLRGRLREKELRQGETLFCEGDPGQEMFVIRRGSMTVFKSVSGQLDQVLAGLGAGNFFGEMSLFNRAPRSATLQAESDTTLYCLTRQDCELLLAEDPTTAAIFFYRLIQTFIERLRSADNLLVEVTRWGLERAGAAARAPAGPAPDGDRKGTAQDETE
ncbi:MAG: cyclic nucleotide-binding domain-containing protein [Candidatus Riflebacteria bacterium]|nr:cyclic nucleotide-binding domain-containing protein [Candidatus Riflebacteria bacterium]